MIAKDPNLIIGGSQGSKGHVTVKLNNLGIRQWERFINGVNTGGGNGYGDVAVDSSDNVYYCSSTSDTGVVVMICFL